ncbi:hypothetical protein [uncultured Flavonifractor sp.]|uniref:hypothetical protein n=1 Tax=uncultured Flavonifractor sp. TaxID=1193534 RepID=UPI0026065FB5|nr:hypothetical protein [uncultured Flavonifractor sp.]
MDGEKVRSFAEARREFNQYLSEVLFRLLNQKGVQLSTICKIINNKYNTDFNTGWPSEYKVDFGKNIPHIFLVEACRLMGISLDELFAQAEVAWKRAGREPEKMPGAEPQLLESKEAMLRLALPDSELFATTPEHQMFNGYYATYFTYFTPTHSGGKGVLKGALTLSRREGGVHVHFELETGQQTASGDARKKCYDGSLVYSAAVGCCYCLLSSPAMGELSFLMFRHFRLNMGQLDCRLALAMTASAGNEDKNPTVHRALISRSQIRDEDLEGLLPLLDLNNSQIVISAEDLRALARENQDYAPVIDHILSSPGVEPRTYYIIRENTVRTVSRDLRHVKEGETVPLISAMRARALSSRYNKISQKADKSVHDYLVRLGYYQTEE